MLENFLGDEIFQVHCFIVHFSHGDKISCLKRMFVKREPTPDFDWPFCEAEVIGFVHEEVRIQQCKDRRSMEGYLRNFRSRSRQNHERVDKAEGLPCYNSKAEGYYLRIRTGLISKESKKPL